MNKVMMLSDWPTPSVELEHLGVPLLVPFPSLMTNHNQVHLQFFDLTYEKSFVGWTKFLCKIKKNSSINCLRRILDERAIKLSIFTGFVAMTNFLLVTVIWKFHYLAGLENLDHLIVHHLRFDLCLY